MRKRFLAAVFAALAAAALAAPALAAPPVLPRAGAKGKWIVPPKKLPSVRLDNRAGRLDLLFTALKEAPNEATAQAIEQRIWAIWMHSRSDTVNLLMSRVNKAVEEKDLDLALTLLDAVVKIRPDYAEGWNRRATIYFMKKDFGRSIADISHVLKLEPRHFGALSGLGVMLQDIGDDKQALEVYRRALAVDPHLKHIPAMVKSLTVKVEGKEI
jgi:tetratricopeptide (TPR) repeat protein